MYYRALNYNFTHRDLMTHLLMLTIAKLKKKIINSCFGSVFANNSLEVANERNRTIKEQHPAPRRF